MERALEQDPLERETFAWQMELVESLQPAMHDYLREQGPELARQLRHQENQDLRDALWAVHDLRLEAGEALIDLYHRQPAHRDLVIPAMRWSQKSQVADFLREEAVHCMERLRRARRRYSWVSPHHVEQDRLLAVAMLFALRSHDSPETEALLLRAAGHCEPSVRAMAVSSLGWRSLHQPEAVLACLQQARVDSATEVRQAARASLARLGECQALAWFTRALHSAERQRVLEAIQTIVVEHLTLLWPELDRLADADDPDIACLAREGLIQMLEEMEQPPRN